MAYSFEGLIHYGRDGKHDGMQTDLVLENELEFLHFDPQAKAKTESTRPSLTSETSKPTPSNTPPPTKLHLLQSGNNHL